MSDSPAPEKPATKKPARAINRVGIGALSAIQIALFAFCVLAANFLAFHHYERTDLSNTLDYSLSSSTKHYLSSDAVTKNARPIKLTLLFRRSAPFYERVRVICEEYAHKGKPHIELEIVDPLRSPTRTQEITAAYGITLVRDVLIIDARQDDSPAVIESADGIKSLNPHVKLATGDEFETHAQIDGKRKITGFQGEDIITARLVEAIEGTPKTMGIVLDKCSFGANMEHPALKSLAEKLRLQNIALMPVQLAGLSEIPANLSGLVIVSPKYDFTDQEIKTLEDYWTRPRAAILALLSDGPTPPKLRVFLRANGVTPRAGRVLTRVDEHTLDTNARGVFSQGISFTADLADQSTTFGGASSSLDIREADNDLINQRIFPMPLIRIDPAFWGENSFGKGNETFDEREDDAQPLFLAASVIRGSEADDRFAADSARMVIVANTDFLDERYFRPENFDFLASAANWLIGRDDLAGITPRVLGAYMLPVLQAQVTFINRINLIFIPAALLLIGTFIWNARRA